MRRAMVLAGILAAACLPAAPAAARTDVHIGINLGAPPQLVVVPGTPVYYAPALPHNYFFYGGQFYVFHNGGWFFGPTFNGPWGFIDVRYVPRPILAVPVQYYRAPPRHWKKHGPPPWGPAHG